MHRFRRSIGGAAAACTLVSCLLSAAPAWADTQPLHLGVNAVQFTSSTCLNDSCSLRRVTATGTVTSSLAAGIGTEQSTLTVDFSPGGTCNIVDESDAFVFDSGTIFVHSHHEDCVVHGLRVDTTFQATGGTGAFQGATGGGREFSANLAAIIFNGTITF